MPSALPVDREVRRLASGEESLAESPSSRILDGALECVSRWGLAKTTLDDVARAAGCSRATVYRQFPGGKPALIEALGAREVVRLLSECVEHADSAQSLEDFLVDAIVTAAHFLSRHDALSYLLRYEPETLAPFLAFDRLEPTLDVTRGFLAPSVARLCDRVTAEAALEWGVRMVISYTFTPSNKVRLDRPDEVRRLVATYFLPGIPMSVAATDSPSSALSAALSAPPSTH